MKTEISLAIGDPWVADCAAKLRTSCSGDWQTNVRTIVASEATVYDHDEFSGATGLDAKVLRIAIEIDSGDSFVPTRNWTDPDQLYVIAHHDPTNLSVGRILGVIGLDRISSSTEDHAGAQDVVSDYRRQLLNQVLGVSPSIEGIAKGGVGRCGNSTAPLGLPKGYCFEPPEGMPGIPRDFFVPLENELTSDSDSFESSWRHYLDLARQAALKTDQLGREIIDLGLQKDLRREAAGEELAGICGDFTALDKLTFEGGEVKAPEDDPELNQCINEPTAPIVFLTTPPAELLTTAQIQAQYLGCPDSKHPMCATGAFSSEDVRYLNLVEHADASGNEQASCSDAATDILASLDGGGLNGTALAELGTHEAFGSAQIRSLLTSLHFVADFQVVEGKDTEFEWKLFLEEQEVMSTLAGSSLWPACGASCTGINAKFSEIFGANAAAKLEFYQRVTGVLWLLGVWTGGVPEGLFSVPALAVNWEIASTGVDEPAPLVYATGHFLQQTNSSPVTEVGYGLEPSEFAADADRNLVGLAKAVPTSFADAMITTDAPIWVREAYARASSSPEGSYVHIQAQNTSYPSKQMENLALWFAEFGKNAEGIGPVCHSTSQTEKVAADYRALKVQGPNGDGLRVCTTPSGTRALLGINSAECTVQDVVDYYGDAEPITGLIPGYPASDMKSSLLNDAKYLAALQEGIAPALCPQYSETTFDGYRLTFVSEACAQGPSTHSFTTTVGHSSTNHLYIRFAPSALKPTSCSPGSRALFFVNSGNLVTGCDAVREVVRAAAFACSLGAEHRTIAEGEPFPPLEKPDDIIALENWIHDQAVKSRQAVSGMVLTEIPERAVSDIVGEKVGTGGIAGQHGDLLLQMEADLRTLANGWTTLEGDFASAGALVDVAHIGIRGVEYASKKELARIAMEHLQITANQLKGAAQVAGGIFGVLDAGTNPFKAGQAGAEIASGAIDIAFGELQQNKLSEIEDIAKSEKANDIAGVLASLHRDMGPILTNMQTTLEGMRTAVGSILQTSSALRQNENLAKYQAAKGSGEDFVVIEGEPVLFPVNTVLSRQYDIAKRRYEDSLNNTKRLAYIARLAIEQRVGQRLSAIEGPVGALSAPALWADDVCSFQGVNYEELRKIQLVGDAGTGITADTELAPEFADPYIGDYVDKLEAFVDYYNIDYPSHEADDVAVLSLRDDLLGPAGQCYEEARNLLAYSDALTRSRTQDSFDGSELEPEANLVAGWQQNPCGFGDASCLRVVDGSVLLDPGGSLQAPPAVSGHGGVSWLHDEAADVDGEEAPVADPVPTRAVYQEAVLDAGTSYVLSWWDMARDEDGEPTLPTMEIPTDYRVTVYGPNWEIIDGFSDIPYYEGSGGAWSPRRTLQFLAADGGAYRIVFNASLPGELGSVAIANVQLEKLSQEGGATAYQATEDGRLVVTSDCAAGSAEQFRDAFRYKCENNACFYELLSPVTIDTLLLDKGQSKLIGKLARGNFNYRHISVAANVVGTGVTDCTDTPTQSCFGSGFVEYSLEHDAFETPILDYQGEGQCFNFGSAGVQHGKALAAERFITLPMGSADSELLHQPQTWKPELSGRPLDGSYHFRVYDSPSLAWDRVEDVQLVFNYRYWSRVRRSEASN